MNEEEPKGDEFKIKVGGTKPEVPKPKGKKKSYFMLVFWVIAITIVILFAIITYLEDNSETLNLGCKDVYLNYCFDVGTNLYGSNIKEGIADKNLFDLVIKIRILEEQGVTILGKSSEIDTIKQLEDFGNYVEYIKLKNIYIDCTEPRLECVGITKFPTWKQQNRIIFEEYIDLNQLEVVNNAK